MPKSYRSSLAKFRCGVAPIRVETGRYENIPFDERLCDNCNVVETEAHCLLECYLYDDIRHELLEQAREVFSDFDNFLMSEKLSVILSDTRLCFTSAKICNLILSRRKLLTYL